MLLTFANHVLGVEWLPGQEVRLSKHGIFLFVFKHMCTVLEGSSKLDLEDYFDFHTIPSVRLNLELHQG